MSMVILKRLKSKSAGLGIMVFVAFVVTSVSLPTQAKPPRVIRKVEADYLHAVIEDGVGFEDLILGRPTCTKDFVKSKLGEPEEEKDTGLSYKNKYGLDLSFTPDGVLAQIRLNAVFKGELISGISMSSKKQDVFEAYGVPVSEKTVQTLNNPLENLVLYRKWNLFGKPKESKIFYRRKGLLFWFKGDDILQIVVHQKEMADSPSFADEADKQLKIEKEAEKEKSKERAIETVVESTFKGISREDNFDVRFPKGAKLVLKNANGSIKISSRETDRCSIKANAQVAIKDEKRAERILKGVRIQVRPIDEIVWVEVELAEELQGNQLIRVDFEIALPQKADLKLSTANGSVDISGIKGDINCEIGNGIITAEEIIGSTRLGINFGEIIVRKADFDKSLITANNGPVTCEGISGNLQVKVNSGKVKVRYAETAPSTCNVDISTNDGDINFMGPVDFSAIVEAKTIVGTIETDLPLTVERRGGSKAAGKLGKGEGKLVLRTTMGSIKINGNVIEKVNQSRNSVKSEVPDEGVQQRNQ